MTLLKKAICQNTQFFTQHLPLGSKSWLHLRRTSYTFSDQITSLSKACYYHIRQLRCIRPYLDSSTACTISASIVHSKLDYCNSLYYKLPGLNYPVSSGSRTLLLVLSLKLVSPAISLTSYALSTGSESMNALNTSSSHLPTLHSSHNYPTSIPS